MILPSIVELNFYKCNRELTDFIHLYKINYPVKTPVGMENIIDKTSTLLKNLIEYFSNLILKFIDFITSVMYKFSVYEDLTVVQQNIGALFNNRELREKVLNSKLYQGYPYEKLIKNTVLINKINGIIIDKINIFLKDVNLYLNTGNYDASNVPTFIKKLELGTWLSYFDDCSIIVHPNTEIVTNTVNGDVITDLKLEFYPIFFKSKDVVNDVSLKDLNYKLDDFFKRSETMKYEASATTSILTKTLNQCKDINNQIKKLKKTINDKLYSNPTVITSNLSVIYLQVLFAIKILKEIMVSVLSTNNYFKEINNAINKIIKE